MLVSHCEWYKLAFRKVLLGRHLPLVETCEPKQVSTEQSLSQPSIVFLSTFESLVLTINKFAL